jgi:hypothetical protein
MRNMSFALTTPQIRNRTKTVTRRVGWKFLKPGDLLRAVEKSQGLKKGETVKPLAVLRVESVRREWMSDFHDHNDCVREGFPGMSPAQFRQFFMGTHGAGSDDDLLVTRIAFSYVESATAERDGEA